MPGQRRRYANVDEGRMFRSAMGAERNDALLNAA